MGSAKAVVRACSVLQFHAIKTFVPIWGCGDGGAINTGRPLSNKPASSVVIRGPPGSRPGLPKTITSKTRPWLPTKWSPSGALSNQPLERAFASPLRTPCVCIKFSKRARLCCSFVAMSCSNAGIGTAATSPTAKAVAGSTRKANPSM